MYRAYARNGAAPDRAVYTETWRAASAVNGSREARARRYLLRQELPLICDRARLNAPRRLGE